MSNTEVFRNPFWTVEAVPYGPDTFYVINQADSVLVIAQTFDQRIALIDTWRVAHRRGFTEFPGGTIEDGETPQGAALRELEEETGLRGGSCDLVGQVIPSTALTTEKCHICLVKDLDEASNPSSSEVRRLWFVEPHQVLEQLIAGGADATAMAAWTLFRRRVAQ